MVKKNACIFISGQGSNLRNLIKKSRDYNFPVSIKLVVCNNSKALGLTIAKKNSIPYLMINTKSRNYEEKILKNLLIHKISIICLAGYMKIISKKFLENYKKKNYKYTPFFITKI